MRVVCSSQIVFSASLLASLSLDDETVDMLMEHRNVYKEIDGLAPGVENASPELVVSLIHTVDITAALTSVVTIAKWVVAVPATCCVLPVPARPRCPGCSSSSPCVGMWLVRAGWSRAYPCMGSPVCFCSWASGSGWVTPHHQEHLRPVL